MVSLISTTSGFRLQWFSALNDCLLSKFSTFSQTAKDRFTSEEARAMDRANTYLYHEVRQAAEAHRQVTSRLCHLNMQNAICK